VSRALPVLLVDAFTDRPLGGNPAACENSVAALSNLSPAEAFFPLV
jgi:predicted PhzF superfamily epimerase YddE/YHI9